MNYKGKILTTIREFVESKRIENKKKEEMIDWETHLVENSTPTKYIEILQEIKKIIKKYGEENVYIGKTCSPVGRMTGSYPVSEATGEQKTEDYEAPPHDKPHDENGYGRMYIISETGILKEILKLEKDLIRDCGEKTRNRGKGGEGRPGSSPYFMYVVVQESAL